MHTPRLFRGLFRKKEKPAIKTESVIIERGEKNKWAVLRIFEFTGKSSGRFYDTERILLSPRPNPRF